MAKDDVAARLVIYDVPDLLERPDRILVRDRWELAHVGTSTVSSQMDGGIGSLCLRRLSR